MYVPWSSLKVSLQVINKSIHVSIVADRRRQSTITSDVIKIASGPSGHGFASKPPTIGILKRFVLYSQYRERSDRQSNATGVLIG